jgi:hypothetical protein
MWLHANMHDLEIHSGQLGHLCHFHLSSSGKFATRLMMPEASVRQTCPASSAGLTEALQVVQVIVSQFGHKTRWPYLEP